MTVRTEDIEPTVTDPGEHDATPHPADEREKTPDQAHAAEAVRATILELMKYGLLEEASKPNLYRNALLHRDEVDRILSWLELALRVDEIRGLAFIVVASAPNRDDDEWSHPLVRRQRLTLEQSLLVAILRQQFVAHEVEAGVGAGDARVALDDLLPHLQAYLGDLGSDARERKRLLTLLEQLKGHGIVSDVDQQERVTIRPIIAHLANPENLTNLVQALREAASNGDISLISVEEADE
jgi:hypothetical protein